MSARTYLAIRGLMDRLVASILFVILLPLLAGLAASIRVSMGSPVLFCQKRIGRDGRPFTLLKFRTMVPNAEAAGGGYMPKEMNLITPLGAFLRRTSLDELPQLVNILRGELAFIGPRPALPTQVRRYTPEQMGRVRVPQGLTGLAQVIHRNNATWSVRISTDLAYIDALGPLTDLKILMLTMVCVIRGTGMKNDQTAADVDDLAADAQPESPAK